MIGGSIQTRVRNQLYASAVRTGLKTHRYGSGVTMTAPATGHRYVYRYEMSSRRPEAAAASDFPVGRGYP